MLCHSYLNLLQNWLITYNILTIFNRKCPQFCYQAIIEVMGRFDDTALTEILYHFLKILYIERHNKTLPAIRLEHISNQQNGYNKHAEALTCTYVTQVSLSTNTTPSRTILPDKTASVWPYYHGQVQLGTPVVILRLAPTTTSTRTYGDSSEEH